MTWSTSEVAVCCSSDFAQFVQQSRIFDGDDGLAGEARDQRDLLVGKGTNFLAVHGEITDQFVVLEHWDKQSRPYTPKFDACSVFRNALLNRDPLIVGNVNHRFGRHHATEKVIRTGTHR